jgi:Family of unknown function (DUF5723)
LSKNELGIFTRQFQRVVIFLQTKSKTLYPPLSMFRKKTTFAHQILKTASMKRLLASIAMLIFTTTLLSAQQEQSLIFLDNVWQSNLLNPAQLPKEKITVALPSIFTNISSPDVAIKDLTAQREGRNVLIVNKLYENGRPERLSANANLQIQTLGITVPVTKNLSLTLHHAATADPSVSVSRDLLRVFAEGNASFLGKTVAFGSTGTGSIRSEFGLGAAYRVSKLTVGARIKALYGIAGVFTQNPKTDVTFNSTDYSMRFQTDFDVLAFKGAAIKDYSGIGSLLSNGFTSSNKGFSLDLGMKMDFDKLQLSASVVDMGAQVKWQSNGTRYQSKGDYTYRGVNLGNSNQFFNWGNFGTTSYIDTLKKTIGLKETTEGVVFTQKLPTRAYLTGTYQFNDRWRLGAMVCHETSGGDVDSQTGFAVDVSTKLLKIIDLGATVGLRNGAINNIGGHIAAKLSVVQVFAVTDNLLTVFNPYGSKNANGRVGLNLAF